VHYGSSPRTAAVSIVLVDRLVMFVIMDMTLVTKHASRFLSLREVCSLLVATHIHILSDRMYLALLRSCRIHFLGEKKYARFCCQRNATVSLIDGSVFGSVARFAHPFSWYRQMSRLLVSKQLRILFRERSPTMRSE